MSWPPRRSSLSGDFAQALGDRSDAETLFSALSDAWVDACGIWDDGRGFGEHPPALAAARAGLGPAGRGRVDGNVVRGIFETIDGSGR